MIATLSLTPKFMVEEIFQKVQKERKLKRLSFGLLVILEHSDVWEAGEDQEDEKVLDWELGNYSATHPAVWPWENLFPPLSLNETVWLEGV